MSRSSPAAENKLASMARRGPKGENRLARMATDAAGSGFMRGLTALPYRLLGAPVDLADMVVRPIANAAGIPIAEPENMYGTSDWMIKHAVNNGLLMPRTGSGAEMGGDFLGQIAAPGVGPGEAAAAKAIFAGPLALTADLEAMRRAQSRLEAGEDAAKVWADEGWFRGPDGKMRFEIDDSQSRLTRGGRQSVADYGYRPQEKVMAHPELYGAYPDSAKLTLSNEALGPELDAVLYDDPRMLAMNFRRSDNAAVRRNLIHENQHLVQDAEGFAKGGMYGDVFTYDGADAKRIGDEIKSLEERLSGGSVAWGSAEAQRILSELDALKRKQDRVAGVDGYRRLAGEVEARAVEARLPLTAEQRRVRYPLQDYDVPLNELIIR